ncbi:putative membrane protein [Kineococcus xinjiangensis]|uniref:Putative membrane protein n=1 Tax=Kineococcus xinjiangensis TaxID=512762 RepID=A0A2S6IWJ0_9ACTN|nr:vitamin K epoxide reductase family protein [Kineococcus xinjiangensis]PPK98722.1 putative membrane protein [Kineococcus xinjiangensis]
MPTTDPEQHLSDLPVPPRRLGLLLALAGALGLAAALVLSVERYRLLLDPAHVPSCSLNPVLACGAVMTQPQAAVLGFPNPFLGLMAFPVPLTLGVLLLAGTPLPRWVRLGFWVGTAAATAFTAWLVVQSVFVIRALCPYCMLVWAVMVPLFWISTADALDRGVLPVPAALRPLARTLVDYRLLLVALTCAALLGVVGVEFWSYWRTLLP